MNSGKYIEEIGDLQAPRPSARLKVKYLSSAVDARRGDRTRRYSMFEGVAQDGVSGPGTVVGANVKLTGTISDVNDITVHGTVEGEVVSDKTIVIAETASVKGPVTAQVVSISGRVNGSITAHQKLELLPTGQVNGSITTKDLNIKSGSTFNGKCVMTDQHDAAPAQQSDSVKKEKSKAEPVAAAPEEPKTIPAPKPEPTKQPETVPASTPTFELED
jgi:cytoskeletal protein CcmA (bactofilin family)